MGWVWKTPSAHNASGAGDFMQSLSVFFLDISSDDQHFDALIRGLW